jgi:DNA repair protein RadD
MLRDYQKSLLRKVESSLSSDHTTVLQLPTGGGKTHIAAKLISKFVKRGKRVWFLCHRRELVHQVRAPLQEFGIEPGIIANGSSTAPKELVQICSIPSLRYRSTLLKKPDLIVWDECHHVAASSWSSLIGRFADVPHLGLTATPNRLDGVALGQWFRGLVKGPSTRTLIEDGTLSDYRMYAPTVPDLLGVNLGNRDYDKNALVAAMERPQITGDVVEHYQRLASQSRALAFCVSVDASRALVERFRAVGIAAEHVDGDTPNDQRDAAIKAFADGSIKVLSNVEIFTEGFDLPAIDAVILLRPTKSLALYHQMVGRGLRSAAGKSKTVILDHSGLCYDHGLPDDDVEWTLGGEGFESSDRDGSRLRRCPDCSCVHAWAVECVECGHSYTANDRSIDETFGTLREISKKIVAKNGCEHPVVFASRIGVNPSTVWSLIRRGLPRADTGAIPVDEALAWLRNTTIRQSNNKAPFGSAAGEYETQASFARRVDLSDRQVGRLIAKGLPIANNGWVHAEPALVWLRVHLSKFVKQPSLPGNDAAKALWHKKRAAYVEFCRLSGSLTRQDQLKARGVPVKRDGSIDVAAALEWIKLNNRPGPRAKSLLPGFETRAAFARRVGIGKNGAMRTLRARGLPFEPNGLIHIESALKWVADHGIGGHDGRNPGVRSRTLRRAA